MMNIEELKVALTGSSINSNIELHNYCKEYLNCSDI